MSVVAIKKVGRNKFEIASDSIRVSGWGTQEKKYGAKLYESGFVVVGQPHVRP